ncbi:MAG: dephospho-CoA kinase, partial [Yaniella sp.]
MRHLALTGGIGSGKSTVATFFAERGATIIDADAISRAVMEPGQQVLAEVVETFGEHLLDEAGRLDRAALASIVFNDDAARERL